MTRTERMAKLWAELTALGKRRAKCEARRQSTAAIERQMVLIRARIIKLEMREEKVAA